MIQLFEKNNKVFGISIDDKFVHIFDPTPPQRNSSLPRPTSNVQQKTPFPSQQHHDKQSELYIAEVPHTIDISPPCETKLSQKSDISKHREEEFIQRYTKESFQR